MGCPELPIEYYFEMNYSYDPDGNLLSDGRFTYTWDAENRLVSIESIQSIPSTSRIKVTFTYDYMGRRVSKTVSSWVNNAWQVSKAEKYAWDGWNCIAKFNASNALQESYLWGEDLSGSLQGAGGVGGLLAVSGSSGTYIPAYDGNGNIVAYVDASNGNKVAEFEYDAFGRTIVKAGVKVDDMVYRFSTKWLDGETGDYYYGYRYYNADRGRWISKDPIEERGFILITKNKKKDRKYDPEYIFVQNDPVNKGDNLGLGDIVPWEQVNWGTKSTMKWKETFLAWPDDFLKKSEIEGKPCGNTPSAKITETKVIFDNGFNLGFNVRNVITQTNAMDLKFVWYTCYRASGAGAVPDTLNKTRITVDANAIGMSEGPFIFGIKLSFYSCEKGCYKRFTTSANISVSEGFWEWREDK